MPVADVDECNLGAVRLQENEDEVLDEFLD
jgi:hypothetical protein